MRVAIVGSRRGADLDHVEQFARALYEKDPDAILVSGGADGVDRRAESTWQGLGGKVVSYRVKQLKPDSWGIEMWKIGSWETPSVQILAAHPTWADRTSALFYRDALVAEHADKVVAFFAPGRRTTGTQTTLDFAAGAGRETYEYFAHV